MCGNADSQTRIHDLLFMVEDICHHNKTRFLEAKLKGIRVSIYTACVSRQEIDELHQLLYIDK